MRVAVIGGTGYIGSAIVERLVRADHEPVVVSRSAPERVATGAESHSVDVRDPKGLVAVTSDADAVVYAAAPTGDWEIDTAAVASVIEGLASSERPLIYTSGIWALGSAATYGGDPADEAVEPHALEISSGRPALERLVTDSAREDVRTVAVRPGIVYGHGGGIPAMLVKWAGEHGSGRYVGDRPDVRWPMVHVDDLADLYVRLLDDAEPGSLVHATSQEGVEVGSIAAAADRAAGGAGVASGWPFDDAVESLGKPFSEALAHDQLVASPRARALGWTPRHLDAVADLAKGHGA